MLYAPQVNDQLVDVLMKTIEGDDWEEICNSDGIRVCRNKLSPDLMIAGRPVRFFALVSYYFPSYLITFFALSPQLMIAVNPARFFRLDPYQFWPLLSWVPSLAASFSQLMIDCLGTHRGCLKLSKPCQF
jgi:hypothetical protein